MGEDLAAAGGAQTEANEAHEDEDQELRDAKTDEVDRYLDFVKQKLAAHGWVVGAPFNEVAVASNNGDDSIPVIADEQEVSQSQSSEAEAETHTGFDRAQEEQDDEIMRRFMQDHEDDE